MKSVLLLCSLFASVSSFAQTIQGGKEASESFIFSVGGIQGREGLDVHNADLKSNQASGKAAIECSDEIFTISHTKLDGETLEFEFENDDVCTVVFNCAVSINEPAIEITVDRKEMKVINVVLPESCSQEPWASARDSRSNSI